MRGVHLILSCRASRLLGSSPHARGPPLRAIARSFYKRIIPACAGSTDMKEAIEHDPEDHPRMRGVHQTYRKVLAPLEGSSPHARGPLFQVFSGNSHMGIIPACAGSTCECR